MSVATLIGSGPLARAIEAALAAHPTPDAAACVVVAGPGQTAAALAEIVRDRAGAGAGAIVVVIGAASSPFDRHLMLAAIEPLAIELAPAARLCAISVDAGAADGAVVDAVRFLAEASCTTGQILAVGPA
ncbi:MAG: hypothetical protein B7Y45_08755 [Sphingomonas sp. 28-66-16]|nr:MAG: hypothetical protein B7Y45_08755 [Sphingomonas sp. 28-66-16]